MTYKNFRLQHLECLRAPELVLRLREIRTYTSCLIRKCLLVISSIGEMTLTPEPCSKVMRLDKVIVTVPSAVAWLDVVVDGGPDTSPWPTNRTLTM
jgi:hypothetical protein